MNCTVCQLDRKKHSKELWKLHRESWLCEFCRKSGSEHSEKLWEMHRAAVDRGMHCSEHKKDEKLYPITLGLGRTGVARVCSLNADPPYDKELVPIYMSCTECNLYLGSIEEDNADILDGMCLKCFREVTGQSGNWCDTVPASLVKMDQTDIGEKCSKSTLTNVPEEEKNGRL